MLNLYQHFLNKHPEWNTEVDYSTSDSYADNEKPPYVQCCAFNQIHTHAVFGTQRGYHVFSIKPFQHRACHYFEKPVTDSASQKVWGGIGIIEMLFKSNIFALVGGGTDPAFPTSKVIVWDDQLKQSVGEIQVSKPVKCVKLHKQAYVYYFALQQNSVVVVLEDKVCIYDHELKQSYPTPLDSHKNVNGICAMCPDADKPLIAFPYVTKGTVRVENLATKSKTIIQAHEGDITCLALSRDGTLLATASDKGTLIRVYDAESGNMQRELRRGSFSASIFCIAFSNDNNFLCCCASSGTIHLFSLGKSVNRTSSLSFLSSVVDFAYGKSEWSFASYTGINEPAICCFGNESSLVRVLTGSGVLHELTFDLDKGGEPVHLTSFSAQEILSSTSENVQNEEQ